MKPSKEEIAARLDAEAKQAKESKVVDIWRPTLTESEAIERKKQIDRGEIPF